MSSQKPINFSCPLSITPFICCSITKVEMTHFLRHQLFVNMPITKENKKHLKNVGPIRHCEPPLHCQSPGVASRTPAIAIAQAACDVHDNNNNNNDNA